jgi:hypothetical protein
MLARLVRVLTRPFLHLVGGHKAFFKHLQLHQIAKLVEAFGQLPLRLRHIIADFGCGVGEVGQMLPDIFLNFLLVASFGTSNLPVNE